MITMPADMGSLNTRKKYTSASEIALYSVDDLPYEHPARSEKMPYSFSEVKRLEREEGRKWFLEVCNGISDLTVARQLGISVNTFRDLRKEFKVDKDPHGFCIIDGKSYKDVAKRDVFIPDRREIMTVEPIKITPSVATSMRVEMRGDYTGQQVFDKLEALRTFLEGQEGDKFEFQLTIIAK